MKKQTRIGCLGGTFDPPHLGHVSLVEELLKSDIVDKVLVIVAIHPYHKDQPCQTSFKDRVAMTRLAMKPLKNVEVCEVEGTQSPDAPSYTIETMQRVQSLYPHDQLVVLMGSDSLLTLHTWMRANEIVDTYEIITYPRPGFHPDESEIKREWSPERAQKLIQSVQYQLKVTDIASSSLRLDAQSMMPFITTSVLKYIRKYKLYGPLTTPLDRLFRKMWHAFTSMIIIYCIISLWGVSCVNTLLFQPHAPSPFLNRVSLVNVPVGSDSDYVTLYGRVIDSPRAYLLYFHGNGEDIGDVQHYMMTYAMMKVQMIAMDYRGYGKSTGQATVSNFEEDVEAAYLYATDSLRIAPEDLILHGRSLGGAAAIYLASKYPVKAVIAESTFLSPYRVVTYYPIFPFDTLPSAERVQKVKSPILFMHGKADNIIPFSNGKRLFELANEPKYSYWHPTAGHNDLEALDPNTYYNMIHRFLDEVDAQQDAQK